MHTISDYLKTQNRFKVALYNSEKIEGMQEFLDRNFINSMLDVDGETFEKAFDGIPVRVPYWVEKYKEDQYRAQYVPGYYEPHNFGDIITIEGIDYVYIDSYSLDAEIEHQTYDGEFCYEYRGSSFMRILKIIS